jgi:quercetin dioxygenase-like cupin family protein
MDKQTIKGPSAGWITMFPGVQRHRLGATAQLYQMEVRLDVDSHVPLHTHPHEQISYVVSGELRFQLGEARFSAPAGSSVVIPANTPHAVWATQASLVVDTFAPPRADYLAADGD